MKTFHPINFVPFLLSDQKFTFLKDIIPITQLKRKRIPLWDKYVKGSKYLLHAALYSERVLALSFPPSSRPHAILGRR